jgi:hypothetical protein
MDSFLEIFLESEKNGMIDPTMQYWTVMARNGYDINLGLKTMANP